MKVKVKQEDGSVAEGILLSGNRHTSRVLIGSQHQIIKNENIVGASAAPERKEDRDEEA